MKKIILSFFLVLAIGSVAFAGPADYLLKAGFDVSGSTIAIVDKNLSIDGANPLIFEGATENTFETTITVTDPTADRTITIPNASGAVVLSSLTTNTTDAANSVTLGSSLVLFEGSAADDYETTVTVTNPTADRTITLPDTSGVVFLANAVAEGANAIWGTANGFYAEGTTADDNETVFYATNPTGDRTITLPDASGMVHVVATYAHTTTEAIPATECWGGTVTNTGAGGAIVLTLPTPVAGMRVLVALTAAQDVDVNPADGTSILTLTNAAGDAISSAATIGNFVWLQAISTTQWIALGSSGTWTDVN